MKMISNVIKTIVGKSITKNVVVAAVKATTDDSVVKEKLGVSTIDEFMKMDIHEYQKMKNRS
jgi:hypothetical protein